jgi:cold-inducible RNA-binding protein
MNRRLFVGNLPYTLTEQELEQLFAQVGPVASCTVIRDKETQRSKGFAFVELTTDDDAQAAIDQFNGHEVKGRPLVVNEAKPREERPARDRSDPRDHRRERSGQRRESRW